MEKYILYGSEMSYFSGNARAYLRWKGIDFEERQSDAKFYEEICRPRIGFSMIPLLITPDDQTLQDTTLIMDHFEGLHKTGPSFTPTDPIQHFVARLIELYAEDLCIISALRASDFLVG